MPKIWGVRAIKSLGTTIQSGQTPLRRNHELYGNDVSWVKTLDLNNGLVSETEERLSYKGFEDLGKKLRPVDTVMVAMYGGAGTIGKCGILAIPATTNQAVCCIEPNDRVFNPRYLLHYMVYISPAMDDLRHRNPEGSEHK